MFGRKLSQAWRRRRLLALGGVGAVLATSTVAGPPRTAHAAQVVGTNNYSGPLDTTRADGVQGYSAGASNAGTFGRNNDVDGVGVVGTAPNGTGVMGESTNGFGVVGVSQSGSAVYAQSTNSFGLYGVSTNGHGIWGQTAGAGRVGVVGWNNSATGYGVFGQAGPNGTTGWAGYFFGPVHVNGTLTSSNKQFAIDHPLDPENRVLYHVCVEASEPLNVYSGNATTDASGQATVQLPDYFDAINRDFRYQLTVLGQFAQAIVASKIQNRQFTIRTDKPSVEVSWAVIGVRNDAFARANPFVADRPKRPDELGTYLRPQDHGQPESRGTTWQITTDQAPPGAPPRVSPSGTPAATGTPMPTRTPGPSGSPTET